MYGNQEGIIILVGGTVSEKAVHSHLMAAMCRILDGEDYHLRYDPDRDFTVLEECLKSVEFLEQKVQLKNQDVFDEMKMKIEEQAVFVTCRDNNFETAKTVYKRLFETAEGKEIKDNKRKVLAEKIKKVIESDNEDHSELKACSYSQFTADMKKYFKEIYDTFSEPTLVKIACTWLEKQKNQIEMDVTGVCGADHNDSNQNNNNNKQNSVFCRAALNTGAKQHKLQKCNDKIIPPGTDNETYQKKLKRIREKTTNGVLEISVESVINADNEYRQLREEARREISIDTEESIPVNNETERAHKNDPVLKRKDPVKKLKRPRGRLFDDASDSSDQSINLPKRTKKRLAKYSSGETNRISSLSSPGTSQNKTSNKQKGSPKPSTPRISSISSPGSSRNNTPNKQQRDSPKPSPYRSRETPTNSARKLKYRKNINRQDRHLLDSSSDEPENDSLFFNSINQVRRKNKHSTPLRSSYFEGPTRKKSKWTPDEEETFYKHVVKCGVGQWVSIKNMMGTVRSNVDLKDKWRHFKSSGRIEVLAQKFGEVQFT